MLEFIICSMLTILPDFLIRRYGQGKRIGHEITLYSVWFELRYGITACAIMTISLITVVFFYHPAAEGATAAYRTVTILPETPGRVTEVMVANGEHVEAGDVLFQLDKSRQEAALETARATLEARLIAATMEADLACRGEAITAAPKPQSEDPGQDAA